MEKGYEDVLRKQKVSVNEELIKGEKPENETETIASYTYGNGGDCYYCEDCWNCFCCDELYYYNGMYLCYNCYMARVNSESDPEPTMFVCSLCGTSCDCSNESSIEEICSECYARGVFMCYSCGNYHYLNERNIGPDGRYYCNTCYDYTPDDPDTPTGDGGTTCCCAICGAICPCSDMHYTIDGRWLCSDCYQDSIQDDDTETETTTFVCAHCTNIFPVSQGFYIDANTRICGACYQAWINDDASGDGGTCFVCDECGQCCSCNDMSFYNINDHKVCKNCYANLPACSVCGARVATIDRHPTKPNMCLTCGKRDDYETFIETICDEDGNEKQFRIIKVKLENIKPEIIVNKIENTSFFGINGSFFEVNSVKECEEPEDANYPDESKGLGISWNYEYEGECQNEPFAKKKNYIYNGNNRDQIVYRDTLVIYRDNATNKVRYEICSVHAVEEVEEYFRNNFSDYKILRMIGGGTLSMDTTISEWEAKFNAESYLGWDISTIDHKCGIGLKFENNECTAYLVQSRQMCKYCDLRNMFAWLNCEAAIFLYGGERSQAKWKENGIVYSESHNSLAFVDGVSAIKIWNMIRIIDTSIME